MEINKDHPLFKTIRGYIIHCTSLKNWSLILKDGFIRPNAGSFPFSWDPNQVNATYKLGGISLLDFTLPEDQIFFAEEDPNPHYPWEGVLLAHSPLTVVFKMRKESICNGIMEWNEIKAKAKGGLIPFIEICCLNPIPVEMIEDTIFVSRKNPSLYLKFDGINIEKKIDIIREWFERSFGIKLNMSQFNLRG